MTKKVLLVGSSFSAAPLFFALKKRGLHVAVCGNYKNDPCHQYADESFFFNYADRDELLEMVLSQDFDYIVPSCNDYSFMSCAWVAEQQSFPGFDSFDIAKILHNKSYFRKYIKSTSVPAPGSIQIQRNDEVDVNGLLMPLLVKPVDSFSGRGVTKITNQEDLSSAIDYAFKNSSSTDVTIEEFVEGNLYSHTAFIQDQEIIFDTIVDEYCTVYPYQVNCSNHPTSLVEELQQGVKQVMSELIKELKLADGLLHTQFIADDDRFWIIECMRRCPGDLYGSLVQFSTGVDYADLYIRPFIGEKLPQKVAQKETKFFSRHTISISESLVNFTYSHNIPSKHTMTVPLKSSGEILNAAPYDKLAILFSEHNNRVEMLESSPRLEQYISIQSLKGY